MEGKVEFLRQGLSGPIYGLLDKGGLVVRQYTAKSAKEAFEFFLDQAKSLKEDDGITSIEFEGKIVDL